MAAAAAPDSPCLAMADEGVWASWLAALQPMAAALPPLDALSVFDGEAAMSSALAGKHLTCESYDVWQNPLHDVTTSAGLQECLIGVLRLRPKGLLFMSPPCKHWAWIARSGHRRSPTQPAGAGWRCSKTYHHNKIAEACAALIRLAIARNVYFCLEQPVSSLMPQFVPLRIYLDAARASKAIVSLGSFGGRSLKYVQLLSNAGWLGKLQFLASTQPSPRRPCACHGRTLAAT